MGGRSSATAAHFVGVRDCLNSKFQAEISPYAISEHRPDLVSGEVRIKQRRADTDEGPRADSTVEKLAKLRPAFAARGSVTAGNSSQMSDGAAAVLLVSERMLKQFPLTPLARFAGNAVAGVPPEIMGIGPIEAIPRALKLAGIGLTDVDWIELNEAFAAQSLALIRRWNSIRRR